MESTVDGSLVLKNQENILNAAQQAGPYLLKTYVKGSPAPTNFASFVDAPLGQDVPNLVLIEIKSSDNVDDIIKQQKALGRALVCNLPAYVSGRESQVATFR
jgi:hypothetical protein